MENNTVQRKSSYLEDPENNIDLSSDDKFQFFLIRHGQTNFNVEYDKYKDNPERPEFLQLRTRVEFIDPPLNLTGLNQALKQRKIINQLNFLIVFVSPMIRACQTAIEMFAEHPNKNKIHFVLAPIIKEGLNCSNDLSHSIEYLYSLFGAHNKEKNYGIEFDFSFTYGGLFGEPRLWNAMMLTDLDAVKLLYKSVSHKSVSHAEINDQILKYMADSKYRRLEAHSMIFDRVQIFKEFVKRYVELHRKLDIHEKYAIVSHASFLRALSSSGVDQETGWLLDYQDFKNCEVKPWLNFQISQDQSINLV
ncbi:UNKNOWN [Stylonychia lemnae]|uniref:Phosphoglycerate mutase family protein n=1 Tax=Stylonychia lemnae TaxID=5949 RepID=A0A077ZYE5_STYLE|nr:UNKNOWN [Stylonychia lemnae]|eukprot:CDW74880.1 UNKNOWN [Stylonychia lemnae]